MFENEKSEWDSLFSYYQDRFQEEIGISFACIENKKFLCEIDFFVGENTDRILGMKLYQEIPKKKKKKKKNNEESEEMVVYYDFALALGEEEEVGKLLFKEVVEKPVNISEDDAENDVKEELIEVQVYSVDGTPNSEITSIRISPKDSPKEILYFSDVSYD
jgi:hypothetical protein